jgi:hypothetical protein
MALLHEQRLTLNDLASQEGVNPSTIWRWSLRGVRGVKLETFSVGSRRFTTAEAFERFVEATTAAATSQSTSTQSSRQREASIAQAERGLANL